MNQNFDLFGERVRYSSITQFLFENLDQSLYVWVLNLFQIFYLCVILPRKFHKKMVTIKCLHLIFRKYSMARFCFIQKLIGNESTSCVNWDIFCGKIWNAFTFEKLPLDEATTYLCNKKNFWIIFSDKSKTNSGSRANTLMEFIGVIGSDN